MALINVGIHENLVLHPDTTINEHGTLELALAAKGGSSDLAAAFEENTTANELKQSYRFYPPNMTTWTGDKKTAVDIAKELLGIRDQFLKIGSIFGNEEEMNAAFAGTKLFEGSGKETINENIAALTSEDFTKKVMAKLSKDFFNYLKDKNAFSGEKSFRIKLVRQSKDKHYSSISRGADMWIEPMSIPKAESKIAYSKWEMDNKYDDGSPVQKSEAQSTPVDEQKASALFKQPESSTQPKL